MPSILCQTRLQPAVDEAKAMPSVFGHCEVVTPEVSDCEHAYEGRASEHSHSLWAALSCCPWHGSSRCELQVHIGQIHPDVDTDGSHWQVALLTTCPLYDVSREPFNRDTVEKEIDW